jgi:LmbE family N-acetylglucosaminyl deacetylase
MSRVEGGRSVLAVAAHPGDLELGCAGTLAAHRAAGDSVTMLVLSCDGPEHPRTLRAEAAAKSLDCLLVWGPEAAERRRRSRDRRSGERGPDRRTRTQPPGAVAAIENVLTAVDADVVYVHAPEDADAARRAAAEATVTAARHGSRILHYAGESTLRFEPSVFVDVTKFLDTKLAVAEDPELIAANARHFGAQARVRYAEAYTPGRFLWDLV